MLLRTFVLCIVLVDMRTYSSQIKHLNFNLSLRVSCSITEKTGRFLTSLCQVLVITPINDKPVSGTLARVRFVEYLWMFSSAEQHDLHVLA